jgi:hypothetical protein
MKFIAIILSLASFPFIAKAQVFLPPLVTAVQVLNNSGSTEKSNPQISSFTAVRSNLLSQLNWSTSYEKSNKGFTIERSTDGTNFSQIAIVPSQAAGSTSTQKHNYIYFDDKPSPGINYYRLIQIDTSGNEAYSTVTKVMFGNDAINVYPNPAKDNVIIDGLSGNEAIELYSQTGQLVKKQKATGPVLNIDISNVINGTYRLTITDDSGKMITKKIMKQ